MLQFTTLASRLSKQLANLLYLSVFTTSLSRDSPEHEPQSSPEISGEHVESILRISSSIPALTTAQHDDPLLTFDSIFSSALPTSPMISLAEIYHSLMLVYSILSFPTGSRGSESATTHQSGTIEGSSIVEEEDGRKSSDHRSLLPNKKAIQTLSNALMSFLDEVRAFFPHILLSAKHLIFPTYPSI